MDDQKYSVALTAVEWGRVCLGLMTIGGGADWSGAELHKKIVKQLPHLADEVLDTFTND